MCDGRTPESVAAELIKKNLGSKVLRVIITVRMTGGADRAAIDRETHSVAEMLKSAGAYMAAPIEGQPLVVAEIDRDILPRVAMEPRVACIVSDQPEKAH
jgi:hypothetical protein